MRPRVRESNAAVTRIRATETPSSPSLGVGAALLIALMVDALSLSIGFGTYLPVTILLTCTAALIIVLAIVRAGMFGSSPAVDARTLVPVALCFGAINFAMAPRHVAGKPLLEVVYVLPTLAALLTVMAMFGTFARRAVAGIASVAMTSAAAVTLIRFDSRPNIDVWVFLTQGADGLAHGVDQYSSCWVGNTDPLTDCVYSYLPGVALMTTPFKFVLGDVRYAWVACTLLASFLIWRLAGPRFGPALASLITIQPLWVFLIDRAWPEPMAFAALCCTVWSVRTRRYAVAILAFGLALATKQTLVVLIPLAAWWPEFGLRRTFHSALVAAGIVLPWLLWDPRGLLHDTVTFHLTLPPRMDALSLQSLLLRHGVHVPIAVSLSVTILAIVFVARLLPRNAFGFALGSALVLLVFDLSFKVAFFNEHSIVLWLVILALAAADSSPTAGSARVDRLVDLAARTQACHAPPK